MPPGGHIIEGIIPICAHNDGIDRQGFHVPDEAGQDVCDLRVGGRDGLHHRGGSQPVVTANHRHGVGCDVRANHRYRKCQAKQHHEAGRSQSREPPSVVGRTIASGELKAHPHMLRALANKGQDTRAIQGSLGHPSITSTAVYRALAPNRFKDFWRE